MGQLAGLEWHSGETTMPRRMKNGVFKVDVRFGDGTRQVTLSSLKCGVDWVVLYEKKEGGLVQTRPALTVTRKNYSNPPSLPSSYARTLSFN
eukprot:CAMPEP_0172603126 /NCGR_PEP_ID=MMETSP1068-20121228/23323_1 /TAXON_ID=35684 /ORGANISM="Pseudopedinella elastica, Strain CCMP716" /LENGTH=91 /DNA_ID=CAMNT_0013404743 /DNA_START=574 /DNA_END=849 /DNA_ORIENTATION=+